jgi:hypothetical protein
MVMASGMDLVLCAIEPGSGQARFGPKLTYALPVAELCDLTRAGRIGLHEDHLAVLDPEPAGDPLTDSALTALGDSRAPLTVQERVDLAWPAPHRLLPRSRGRCGSRADRRS